MYKPTLCMLSYILNAETIVGYVCDVRCRIRRNFWELPKIRRTMIDEHMSVRASHSYANRLNSVNNGGAVRSEVKVEQ